MATDGINVGEKESRDEEDKELERLAVEALLEDVERRKDRVERVGTMGWVKERSVNKRFLNSLVLQTIPHRESVGGRGSGRDSEDDARQAASDWRHEDGDGREESGRPKRRRVEGGMGGSGSDQRSDKRIRSRGSSRYSHDRQGQHTHRREYDTNRREYDARSRQHDTNRSERSLHHSSRERPREHTRH